MRPRHRSQQPDIDRKATEPGANSTRRSRSARLPQRRQRRARQRLALQEVARCPCRPSCSRRGTCTGHAKYPNPGLQTDRCAVGHIGRGWIHIAKIASRSRPRRGVHGAEMEADRGVGEDCTRGRSRALRESRVLDLRGWILPVQSRAHTVQLLCNQGSRIVAPGRCAGRGGGVPGPSDTY